MLVKGLIMKIYLKFKKSLPSNTHYILIFWRGSTEFTSLLRQPLYNYTEMREPTCSGRLVPPLWEEVTQLSLAKSDSVIRPGGLGGTIWFQRATGRKSRKMSNEEKSKTWKIELIVSNPAVLFHKLESQFQKRQSSRKMQIEDECHDKEQQSKHTKNYIGLLSAGRAL